MLYGPSGQKQSTLQWILLMLLMLSLGCDSVMGDHLDARRKLQAKPDWKAPEGSNSAVGMFLVGLKVVVSCLCAVLSDKYMKDTPEPNYIHVMPFKVVRCVTLDALVFIEASAIRDGVFHELNPLTVASLASLIVKGWSSMYLRAIADYMVKSIGEACLVMAFVIVFCFTPSSTASTRATRSSGSSSSS